MKSVVFRDARRQLHDERVIERITGAQALARGGFHAIAPLASRLKEEQAALVQVQLVESLGSLAKESPKNEREVASWFLYLFGRTGRTMQEIEMQVEDHPKATRFLLDSFSRDDEASRKMLEFLAKGKTMPLYMLLTYKLSAMDKPRGGLPASENECNELHERSEKECKELQESMCIQAGLKSQFNIVREGLGKIANRLPNPSLVPAPNYLPWKNSTLAAGIACLGLSAGLVLAGIVSASKSLETLEYASFFTAYIPFIKGAVMLYRRSKFNAIRDYFLKPGEAAPGLEKA